MNLLQKLWSGVLRLVNVLIEALLAAMTFVIVLGVFYRYVLLRPIAWAEEFSRYCMIWFAMFGAMLALIQNEHVGVSAIIDLFPARVKKWIQQFGRVLIIAFLGVVFGYSIVHLISVQGQTSSAMQIPMFIPYMSISAGTLLMLLVAVRQLFGLEKVKSADASLNDTPVGESAETEKGKVIQC